MLPRGGSLNDYSHRLKTPVTELYEVHLRPERIENLTLERRSTKIHRAIGISWPNCRVLEQKVRNVM